MPSKWRQMAKEAESQKPYESKWKKMAKGSSLNPEVSEPVSDPGFIGTILNDQGSKETASSIKETVGNIPGGLKKYGEEIIYPFAHPVNTAESIVNLAVGVMQKLPGGVYITPGPDYDIAGQPNKGEQAINAVVDDLKETYGSKEKFLRAVKKDPVRIAADLSAVLMGGGGILQKTGKVSRVTKLQEAGKILTKTGAFLDPLNIATTPMRGLKSLIPKDMALKFYESAAKFPSSIRNEQNVIKTALEHQIMSTFTGLIKLGHKLDNINTKISTIIDEAANTGQRIRVSSLLKDFGELKEHARLSFKGKSKIAEIDNIKQQLIDTNSRILPDGTKVLIPLTVKQAQKLKQNIYKEFETYYARANSTPISARSAKLLAKNTKKEIEVIIPEIKQLNKNDGDLIALRKAIDKVAPRIGRRDFVSLGTTVKTSAGGALLGPPGLVGGFLIGMLDSQPIIKARVALLIHKMKQKGINVRMTPTVLRILSYETGRTLHEGSGEEE